MPSRLRAPHRLVLALVALAVGGCSGAAPEPFRQDADATPRLLASLTVTVQDIDTEALLISAHALDTLTVWAAGTKGTVARTTDGGRTWASGVVPGADTLQFRDVYAFSADEALVLSIGPGEASRIYRTADGGDAWELAFVNPEPDGFFDCLAFWDARHGFAFSDSVDGRFLYAETSDGGRSWALRDALPAATEGEGGFASSGTCAAAYGRTGWIATGNAAQPRILRTTDRGATWTSAPVPLDGGDAAGATSVSFRGDQVGLAVGGSLTARDLFGRTVARSADGGQTWTLGDSLPFPGAAYGVAWLTTLPAQLATGDAVAVGPGGVGVTGDGGLTWGLLSEDEHWGLAVAPTGAETRPRVAWLVGPEGRITRVDAPPLVQNR